MLSAFLSLYAYGVLLTDSLPTNAPHIMPWNENVLLEATKIPEKNQKNIAPIINAKSAIVVDMNNGIILYENNIHEPLPIASLTKLMTTVIVIEEIDPKETAIISKNAAHTEGSTIWLAEGEKITVENLLYAALINSANDSAVALAEHSSGTTEKFVEKMNNRSKELGMLSTNFVNPTGLDEDFHFELQSTLTTENQTIENSILPLEKPINKTSSKSRNISTAYDLTLLSRYAFGKSFIRRAVTKKELQIASVNETLTHKLNNTNELLNSYLHVLGLKTGTTDAAGECLIAVIANENGNDIMTIVLNSPSRYKETKILADWALRTYTWK